MNTPFLLFPLLVAAAPAENKMTAPQLIEMVRSGAAGLHQALVETLGRESIQEGTAVLGRGEDFIWAVQFASRAIGGLSSGGICAFNVAWQQPDQFSRVLSWIGSFVSLQPEPNWGGQAFPAMVQREPKRNIRVWLQDGSEDYIGWPEQNIQLANALKRRGYDFHFSYGAGGHSPAQGNAEFPQSWRDYDPAKTEQEFVIDPSEETKPFFRIQIYNRDHSASY